MRWLLEGNPPRRLAAGLVLTAALALAPAASADVEGLKYSIRVGGFENRSGHGGWRQLSSSWGTILTDKLNQTGRFIVIGGHGVRQEVLEEQAFGISGVAAQGKLAPAAGQMALAQLLVKGVITDFQSNSSNDGGGLQYKGVGLRMRRQRTEIHATFYVVDTSTGALVASKSVMGESTQRKRQVSLRRGDLKTDAAQADNANARSAMTDALDEAVEWMTSGIGSLPWRGSIVAIEGDRIIIDRGAREGAAEGLELTVGESRVLRSSETGEVLDEIVTERARVRIVRVKEKVSICEVVSGDPTIVSEGMGVMPASP